MLIDDVMSRDPVSVQHSSTIRDAASRMASDNIGSLPVIEDGRLSGVITDRDIAIRAVAKGRGGDTVVSEIMTTDVVTFPLGSSVSEAADLMSEKQIRRLYVVDGQALAGVVSLGDLALGEAAAESGKTLRDISQP